MDIKGFKAKDGTIHQYDYTALANVPEQEDSTGSGLGIIGAKVGQTVEIIEVDEKGVPTKWKSVNFPDSGGNVELDTTLTQSGKAADAKAVGDSTAVSAEYNEDTKTVSFKNTFGVEVFNLDLSSLVVGEAIRGELIVSVTDVALTEGGSGTFTIALASAPNIKQVVYLATSDDTKVSVSPASLTFDADNWNVPQTITVTSLQDDDEENESVSITATSKNVEAKVIAITVKDDDKSYAVVTDGLTLNFELRDGNLTDSVGGVVATNSGTVVDGGVQFDSTSTKFQFVYPVQNTNFPNGVTIEYAITNIADFQGAGNGFGDGYAYKGQVGTRTASEFHFYGGFAYSVGGATTNPSPITGALNSNAAIDLTSENHICIVYNTDGSAVGYLNGVPVATRDAIDGFENYLASGNITFKIPYNGIGALELPAVLHELRIYERALTADEVLNNYDCTVANQNAVNF